MNGLIYTDQMANKIILADKPKRIISLVPSQTELLYHLGLRDEVVGITKFCIYPEEWFNTKPRIGGTKKYDFEKIKLLHPDLIIGNKEENEQEQIALLMKDYNVWMSDIYTLQDALKMIVAIGALVGKTKEAINLKLEIEAKFSLMTMPNAQYKKVAYFIWNNPYMVAGKDTFIDDMLTRCGFMNVFSEKRYPQVTQEQLIKANPEFIMLSSEPYPFKEKHIQEFKQMCPNAQIMIVDGELFSWYGSRLLYAPEYFKGLM